MTVDIESSIESLRNLLTYKLDMVLSYLSRPATEIADSLPSIIIATALLENRQEKHIIGVIGATMDCKMPTLDKKYSGRFSEARIACRECSNMFYKSPEISAAFRWMNMVSRNIESGWVAIRHEEINGCDVIISPVGGFEDQRICAAGVFEAVVKNNMLVSPIKAIVKNGLSLRPPDQAVNHSVFGNMLLYGPLSKLVEHGFVVKNNKAYIQYHQVHRIISVVRELMLKE